MEVIPGKSVGAFALGMPIGQTILWIQQKNKSIAHVDLKYHEENPLSMDIILDLIEDGILLRFDPYTQKMKMIEVYNVSKVKLAYSGSIFSGLDKFPTLVNVSEIFGPTHPGEYDPINQIYCLHYPGLSFAFPIPQIYKDLYSSTEGRIPSMEFPDGSTPVASRVFLYCGASITDPEIPAAPNSNYFEKVILKLEGLFFTNRNCFLDFTSSSQDVLSILGPPSRIFEKEEDKMKIHNLSYSGLSCSDYFYNYFELGIDILFDIHTHVAKKFILHSNFPSHYEFNQYVKCNFELILHRDAIDLITPNSKWSQIQGSLANGLADKPVIHSRGSNANPFGPTIFYGYKNLIFEVMQNDHIASVCLFSS